MKLKGVNLQRKLERVRDRQIPEEELMSQVRQILEAETEKEADVLQRLQEGSPGESNPFMTDLLEPGRVFHISHIRKLCIDYRLRFLDTAYYKEDLPMETLLKVKELEREHHLRLQGFKIVAPAAHFRLENADDPMLFAPIGNDYYYLVHQWGKDLHPLRKFFMWPVKNLENLLVFSFVVSFFLTFVIREVFFWRYQETSQFIMLYMFTFKSVAGLILFYGIALGKNFSESIWRSRFFNA